MNFLVTPKFFDVARENTVLSLEDVYLEIEPDVTRQNVIERFECPDNRKLVNLGPIVLFIESSLVTTIGRHLENFDHTHIICLIYEF